MMEVNLRRFQVAVSFVLDVFVVIWYQDFLDYDIVYFLFLQ